MKQIHVDYLCKEPFWKFTKRDDNQYCKVCKEDIIDFTQWDEKSVIDHLKLKDGNSCGLFYKEQFIIDDATQTGPSLKAMLIAGGLSSVFSIQGLAQKEETGNNTKIELQKDIPIVYLENVNYSEVEKCDTTVLQTGDKPEKEKKVRKKHRLYIGNSMIFINFKFPFLHVVKPYRGKFAIKRF